MRLIDDACLLAQYHRHGTAFSLSIFALEEVGKVAMRCWGEADSRNVKAKKWTFHQRKQAAATALLQAEVADAAIEAKLREWGLPNKEACTPLQHQELRSALSLAIGNSREQRLLDFVAVGATERLKHVSLYVDDWSLDHNITAGFINENECHSAIAEARRAVRLLRSRWLLRVARAIYEVPSDGPI